MATIADISQELGDYMLKGWVLTDKSCPTSGCAVPLLRSPKGRTPITTICVKCNNTATPPNNSLPAASSNASSDSHNSRSSTPPTEFSEAPSSPIFVPLEETEESRRRREQSDQASSEIGKRLLKGWAMLGDECPNDTCYGVPLVRPPKSGGEKDPRKECVICGHTYVSEIDWAGRETLAPFVTKANAHTSSTQSQASSSQGQSVTSPAQNALPFSSPFGRHVEDKEKVEKTIAQVPPPPPPIPSGSQNVDLKPSFNPSPSLMSLSSAGMVLDETSQALQASLQVLSGRLTSLSSHATMDPVSVGATADAINKVAQALGQVQHVQRFESK